MTGQEQEGRVATPSAHHTVGHRGVPETSELSSELRVAVWSMWRRMRVEGQDASAVPLAQQAVLALLDESPGMTSAELARAEFVRPQSMAGTVAALREAGLVCVEPSPVDGRRHELSLTTDGQDLLGRIRAQRSEWLARRMAEQLDSNQRRVLHEASRLIRGLAAG